MGEGLKPKYEIYKHLNYTAPFFSLSPSLSLPLSLSLSLPLSLSLSLSLSPLSPSLFHWQITGANACNLHEVGGGAGGAPTTSEVKRIDLRQKKNRTDFREVVGENCFVGRKKEGMNHQIVQRSSETVRVC